MGVSCGEKSEIFSMPPRFLFRSEAYDKVWKGRGRVHHNDMHSSCPNTLLKCACCSTIALLSSDMYTDLYSPTHHKRPQQGMTLSMFILIPHHIRIRTYGEIHYHHPQTQCHTHTKPDNMSMGKSPRKMYVVNRPRVFLLSSVSLYIFPKIESYTVAHISCTLCSVCPMLGCIWLAFILSVFG